MALYSLFVVLLLCDGSQVALTEKSKGNDDEMVSNVSKGNG